MAKPSPTSYSYHQHISSPISVTNIDVILRKIIFRRSIKIVPTCLHLMPWWWRILITLDTVLINSSCCYKLLQFPLKATSKSPKKKFINTTRWTKHQNYNISKNCEKLFNFLIIFLITSNFITFFILLSNEFHQII